jgi:hypothetical protein
MSLTQAETVFGSVDEQGIDDLLRAFFTARPRHLSYGAPAFVPVTTVARTSIPALVFPGVPGGIHYSIEFAIPTVDIHPDSSGGTPLPPGKGEFVVATAVRMCVLCGPRRHPEKDDDRQERPICVELRLFARCRPIVVMPTPGSGQLGIEVLQVEIVDIKPDELESILECVLKAILQAALANFRLPFNTITAGAFGLILLAGPAAEDNQIKVRGKAL